MRSYLHIKGKGLWKFCAFVTLAILLACCGEEIQSVDQPATAVAGSTITVKVSVNIPTASNGGPDNLVLGILVPKAWNIRQNTTITYSGPTGSGIMTVIPESVLPKNGNGLTWAAYMKQTFKIAGNLIDDMEWVPFQTDKGYTHDGTTLSGVLNIQMKVGADGNNTLCKLAYVITDTGNGFTSNQFGTYYSEKIVEDCFEVTGGSGDLIDFCNPQLTIVDPPKSLDNDLITMTFDGTVASTPLDGEPEVYLCATAYTNDGKTINVCEQTDKTKLTQTSAVSKRYQLTIWPRTFFGLTDAQTIVKMEYFLKDKTGTKKVGYGNTDAPFVYTFKCQ